MLIIPVEHRPDLRNPPWATLLLILINCLVFFSYQSGDGERIETLLETYRDSALIEVEAPIYIDYLRDEPRKQQALRHAWAEGVGAPVALALLHDLKFETELHRRVDYLQAFDWRSKRAEIEALRDRISYVGYGFIPALPSLLDAFVSMFLHGDLGHLLGNMLFLFLFGFMLEIALGRGAYIGLYLLAGFGATGLFWLMDSGSYIYGVGASGAISGLMGMYLALYGMKKIQFFYWIGFYFNYFKAPALLLFPFWVGKELLGELSSDTNVNYWAHIGGLLSGYLLILAYRYSGLKVDQEYLHKVDPDAPLKAGLKRVDDLTAELDLEGAKRACAELLGQYPGDLGLLQRQYKLLQNDAQSREFHLLALKIFALPVGHLEDAFVLQTYGDYQRRAKLGGVLQRGGVAIKLARRFIRMELYAESYQLVRALATRGKPEAALPPLLLMLAKKLRASEPQQSRQLVQWLLKQYPDSEQAQALQRMRRS